jgi:hypothetical protein
MQEEQRELLRQKKDATELLKRYEEKRHPNDSAGASNGVK